MTTNTIVEPAPRTRGDDVTSPHPIIEIAVAFWSSKVLLTAVDLGVFSTLAGTSLTGAELAGRLGLRSRATPDFLDALVAMDLLDREDGRYRPTPLAARYLDPSLTGTDISGYLGFLETGFGWWGHLGEGLRRGERLDFAPVLAAGSRADGSTAALTRDEDGPADTFAEAFASPEQVHGFLRAMTGYSMGANQALARRPDWADARTVVDVGCAEGSLLSHVAAANPHLVATGFDLPQVRDGFEAHVAAAGLAGQVGFAGGDFFTDPLPTADVLVFGHVLHDWDVDTRRMLLRKAFDALEPGGRVIVYESLIDDDRRRHLTGLLISMNVSLVSNGGTGYTGAECTSWMREAGFRETRVEHLDGPEWAVVGIR